jgi:hypothetical protein
MGRMYDGLTARYTFPCPRRGEVQLPLSEFRVLERLPGATHPAVYKVTFACSCGDDHEGLVTHDELDWAPIAGPETPFLNLMTAQFEASAEELLDLAATRIRAGLALELLLLSRGAPKTGVPIRLQAALGGG